MFSRTIRTISGSAIFGWTLALILAAPASAQTYTLVDLGPCTPEAINRNGQVTGHRRFSASHAGDHAFLWNPANPNSFTDLGLPKGYTSGTGLGLNNAGDVAGYANNHASGPYVEDHALLWPAGGIAQFLGSTKNSVRTLAFAINESKNITGTQFGTGGGAFLSKVVSGKRTLFIIGPGTGLAINTSGQIVVTASSSYLWTPSGNAGAGSSASMPSGYSPSALTDLGAISGSRYYFTIAPWGPYDSSMPVVFFPGGPVGQSSSWQDIPWPAAIAGYEWIWGGANAINSNGVVVGVSDAVAPDGSDLYKTWVWDALNGTRILDTLIPSGTGWTLFNLNGGPTTINDNGWIAGTGTLNGEKRGFVLKPN